MHINSPYCESNKITHENAKQFPHLTKLMSHNSKEEETIQPTTGKKDSIKLGVRGGGQVTYPFVMV